MKYECKWQNVYKIMVIQVCLSCDLTMANALREASATVLLTFTMRWYVVQSYWSSKDIQLEDWSASLRGSKLKL